MLPKYTIEFAIDSKRNSRTNHFSTDDPVACEDFLVELLERNLRVCTISHEGLPMSQVDFDAFIKGWRTVWVADPDGNIVEISQGFQDE